MRGMRWHLNGSMHVPSPGDGGGESTICAMRASGGRTGARGAPNSGVKERAVKVGLIAGVLSGDSTVMETATGVLCCSIGGRHVQ
jgi:hypothetical protein